MDEKDRTQIDDIMAGIQELGSTGRYWRTRALIWQAIAFALAGVIIGLNIHV